MFTVLIKYQKTKAEVLFSAKTVEFASQGELGGLTVNRGVEAEQGFHLSPTPEGDDNWRDVFVMNDRGQTVARYIL